MDLTENLATLEQKIDQLLTYCKALEADNRRLKQQQKQLEERETQLLQVTHQSQQKIEQTIKNLKTLEQRI